jgi:SHS2 domain-containing protein
MYNYTILEHTADLGVNVRAESHEELFKCSANAMFDLISDIRFVRPITSFNISLSDLDMDALLRNWLAELLYYFHSKAMLFCVFDIKKLDSGSIISIVSGEKIDKTRHELKHEIKAVTFHSLKIIESNNMIKTDIIFDV